MMPTTLAARWQLLCSQLEVPEAAGRSMFQQLSAAYEASDRHYHNLAHIRALLTTLEAYAARLQDAPVVALAVWFHDAVYNPMRDDNEARSAALAQEFLAAHTNLAPARRARVAYLIDKTKDHTQPRAGADPDLDLFLDADLQVLGATEADYWRYARQVREEYSLVPDILYRRGRTKVLTQLLNAPQLYHTPDFRQRLDAAARRNLQAELDAWQKGGL
ncbi:hypothetical protein LJY25_17485 [Hymenobacter sp. BT175]|uniref:HD domain-containing protein n=1 Tax=Hymenobacter translucens TaxID=2886507 RepID=UPI001D0F2097|nr:hypothetical protein [Hymenobacter translucens]MCC2548246.1 hypothetical protein [Hymenobacter translucens]